MSGALSHDEINRNVTSLALCDAHLDEAQAFWGIQSFIFFSYSHGTSRVRTQFFYFVHFCVPDMCKPNKNTSQGIHAFPERIRIPCLFYAYNGGIVIQTMYVEDHEQGVAHTFLLHQNQ